MWRILLNHLYPLHPSHDPLDCSETEEATWRVIRRKSLRILALGVLLLVNFLGLLIVRHEFSLLASGLASLFFGLDIIIVHRYRLGTFGNLALANEIHTDGDTYFMIWEEAEAVQKEIARMRKRAAKKMCAIGECDVQIP
jgi:hypothetical protein